MIVYTLLAATILLAAVSLWRTWSGIRWPFAAAWHRVLAAIGLGGVVYLYGPWFFLSVYLKYMFGICMIAVLATGIFRQKTGSVLFPKWKIIANTCLALIFTVLILLYFTGTTGKPDKAQLAFPLREGKYFIMQGGKGLPANLFHYGYRGAIYAIDIARLNDAGSRANKIFSSNLEDYYIFNDTVYSPCDGQVLKTENDNPDNIPPSRKRGPTNTNQVLIENDSFFVFMAHLRKGSVLVQAGQQVSKGQPLARVGNSGFTLEPHLHIQVHKNSHSGQSWYHEKPLYIDFDGRTYLLFETITPRKVDMVD